MYCILVLKLKIVKIKTSHVYIIDHLELNGISVWVDVVGLTAGADFLQKIGQAILDSKVSNISIKNKSGNVMFIFVSSNPAHGEVYSIQHYVVKFVSNLRQVDGFLQVLRFHLPIKLTTTI